MELIETSTLQDIQFTTAERLVYIRVLAEKMKQIADDIANNHRRMQLGYAEIANKFSSILSISLDIENTAKATASLQKELDSVSGVFDKVSDKTVGR